jgi:hypothetical protein
MPHQSAQRTHPPPAQDELQGHTGTHSFCLASFPLILISLPQLLHPPARLPPPFTLTSSTCFLIPLGLRIHLWVSSCGTDLSPVSYACSHGLFPTQYLSCSLSPATPSQSPAHTCSTPCTTDTDTTLDSLVGPPASATSVLLGSPVMSP